MTLIFDIETGPLPEEEVLASAEPFNPDDVKLGNVKDAEKIKAKLEEAKKEHRQKLIDDAALDPITGRILCIGIISPTKNWILDSDDEKTLIADFWNIVNKTRAESPEVKLVGFNISQFDLRFLAVRGWKYGIAPPTWLRRGRYFTDVVVDLRDEWTFGDKYMKGSLDSVARFLGVGKKETDGKNFHKLWAEDRPAAIQYVKNDLELTLGVCRCIRPDLVRVPMRCAEKEKS